MYKRLGELGINKIAYAHNKDDFIETALMSLIYEGRFYAFPPVTYLPEAGVTQSGNDGFMPAGDGYISAGGRGYGYTANDVCAGKGCG